MMAQAKTLFQKIWEEHLVAQQPGSPGILYIDLHLIHEVTSPQAFSGLRGRGLKVRRPDRTVGTIDHSIPTLRTADGSLETRLSFADDLARRQIAQLTENTAAAGIRLFGPGSGHNGIVHVIGPELGLTQPGMTIVCGDSHTSTHGAFGALAFGIGTSEVEHVLASQCLLQRQAKTFAVRIEGKPAPGISSKDIILALIRKIGVSGGTGHVLEYTGSAIRAMDMDERMTICNMSIEAGARAGLIAPDDTTFEYLSGRMYAPQGPAWDAAVARWRELPTDEGAVFDHEVSLDVSGLEPMITFGTNPGMGMPVTGIIPRPETIADATEKAALEKALRYMDLRPGTALTGHPVDVVFIGSCTNSRITDLRMAAEVFRGRRVAEGVRVLVVPGSEEIKRQAEAERLDRIFSEAGAEWREPGCSMCIAMNGDQIAPGQYAVSTSNRNFEGRQGKGGRTFLASPLTAAAAAVTGRVTDVRTLLRN